MYRIWDIRPFAPSNRCQRTLLGHQHNFEKNLLRCAWNNDDTLITAGSADRFVCVWSATEGRMVQRLGGHHGSVNEVDFHPHKDIIASCSSDKTIYIGELQK